MDISKFDINLAKPKNRYFYRQKFVDYGVCRTLKDILDVLKHEAPNYVRKIRKIPDAFKCITYITKEGKVAVLALDTPRKRLAWKNATAEEYYADNSKACDDVKDRYGFIPRPINVLKKFVEYGYMKSQDVEHLYHYSPVDYKICNNLQSFRDAYAVRFDDKDVLMPGFNGYSCMSEEPNVGAFYYYFGAYILVFYAQGTDKIVGRMILWKWQDQLYFYKGYVLTQYQVKAAEVVNKLEAEGKIKRSLPLEFNTSLQRYGNKSPSVIYDNIADWVRVPYIDEDLMLSADKTKLSFCGHYECKKTGCQTLEDYGLFTCEECGEEFDEDNIVEVDDCTYCTSCAKYCEDCNEWFAPDADGDTVDGDWYCQDCLDDKFTWCEQCQEYVIKDEIVEYGDDWGYTSEMCRNCAEKYCAECYDCGHLFGKDLLVEAEDGHYYCKDCYEEHKKEA